MTSAEFALIGTMRSLEEGRASNFLQGPGESPVISGEGRGVTSAIALNIGEDKAEFGAEPKFEMLPTLLANMFLILGVRTIGFMGIFADFEGFRLKSVDIRSVLSALAAVTV